MMELWKFEGKQVQIIQHNGKKFVGKVGDYIWEDDNEEYGCDAIHLYVNGDYNDVVQLNSTDIKSIEILE